MKIGTLTFHRACNNGALLQAYALITYLNKIDGVEAIWIYSDGKISYTENVEKLTVD